MSTLTFNTLKFVKKLESAGMSGAKAEAIAEAQRDAFQEMMKISEMATRKDLVELKFDLLKWIVGLAFAQVSILIGILIKVL